MSLLDLVSNVAEECGYTVGTTVTSATDVTTKQLYRIANRMLEEIATAFPWSYLDRSAEITLVDGQANYALPGDFSSYHFNTFWNESKRWRVLGPMTPQEYAEVIGYGLTATVYDRFMLSGIANNQFVVSPTPTSSTAGQIIFFMYISNRYARPRTWAAGQTIAASGEYTFYNGNYYTSTGSGTTGATPPTWTTGTQSDGGVSWTYYSGGYSEFLADTDEPIFEERLVEQGMLERFAEYKKIDFKERFKTMMNEEFSKNIPSKNLYAASFPWKTIWGISGKAYFGSSRW